jgi:CubicO group peptidase (beta-lactamase class C family)
VERGKVQLDEPVGKLVGGLTLEASKVTIRELLTHTSGLGDFFRPENMAAMMRARSATDILPLIANDKPAYPPGTKFSYSNSGFALLGIVVERASGMTYGDYLQRYVFAPAGMSHTGLDPNPLATLAVGMTAGGIPIPGKNDPHLVLIGPGGKPLPVGTPPPSGPPKLIGPDGQMRDATTAARTNGLRPAPGATEGYGSPAGGLFSTALDMDRFATALMGAKLLRPGTVAQFTSPQVEAVPATAEGAAKYYGFGFNITEENGLRWFGHNGGTLGANAEFAVQPDHQWVVSVLSNRDPPTATKVMAWTRAVLTDRKRLSSCTGVTAQ